MPLNLAELTAEIARDESVNSSASTLIIALAAQIEAAAGDQTALDALVASLRANSTSLAAAVAANTPGAS